MKNFEQLKRKSLISAILKSVALGASAGFLAAGAVMLALTLTGNAIHWGYYILIFLLCALGVGGAAFFILRPTEKTVAKKYDEEYGLGEKLQTMVEFKEQKGDIVELQRQDVAERLAALPEKKLEFKRIWQYCACALLAVCIFTSGVCVTAIAANQPVVTPPDGPVIPPDDNPEEDPAFEYDLYLQAEIADLIGDIRDVELGDNIKQIMIAELENLDTALKDATLYSEMKKEVYTAVGNIDEAIVAENSFRTLSDGIKSFDGNISAALLKGLVVYKNRVVASMPISYVRSLRTGIGDYIDDAMEAYFEEAYLKFEVSQIVYEEGEKNLAEVLEEYTLSLDGALTVMTVAEEDALRESFVTLLNSLKAIKRQVTSGGTANSVLWGRINENLGIMKKSAVSALSLQAFNCIVEVYLRQRLEEIFAISFDGLAELYQDLVYEGGGGNGGGNIGGDDDPGNIGGGGIGGGDVIFGSDDLIYCPATGKYEKFGDVLAEYENAIINGTLDEEFPEYLRKYFEYYLNYLHNGTDKN